MLAFHQLIVRFDEQFFNEDQAPGCKTSRFSIVTIVYKALLVELHFRIIQVALEVCWREHNS